MHKDPDTYQANNEISCSDYRFVYMGAKGLSTNITNFSFLVDTYYVVYIPLILRGQKTLCFLSTERTGCPFYLKMYIPWAVT
jgi:hypothetical protein